jgi:hypothetical protein
LKFLYGMCEKCRRHLDSLVSTCCCHTSRLDQTGNWVGTSGNADSKGSNWRQMPGSPPNRLPESLNWRRRPLTRAVVDEKLDNPRTMTVSSPFHDLRDFESIVKLN